MKRFCLLSVLLLSVTLGCESTAKFLYGVKSPKAETSESLKRYLVKHKIDTTNVLYFNSAQSLAAAGQQSYVRFPDIIFYNKAGKRVLYSKTANDCNARVDEFLLDLKNFHLLEETETDIAELTTYLTPGVNELADVNIFITWTTYSGRLNKTKAFDWVRLIEKAKSEGISINYYMLSADFMYDWKEEIEQMKNQG